MIHTIYNPTTGEILGTIAGDFQLNWPTTIIEGSYPANKFYINLQTLQPIEKPQDPSNPLAKYDFDFTTGQWIYNSIISADLIRANRNLRLLTVDKVNPIWYSSLTNDQQQELQKYRQDLLDISQQSGFPQTVIWPTKPTWL